MALPSFFSDGGRAYLEQADMDPESDTPDMRTFFVVHTTLPPNEAVDALVRFVNEWWLIYAGDLDVVPTVEVDD